MYRLKMNTMRMVTRLLLIALAMPINFSYCGVIRERTYKEELDKRVRNNPADLREGSDKKVIYGRTKKSPNAKGPKEAMGRSKNVAEVMPKLKFFLVGNQLLDNRITQTISTKSSNPFDIYEMGAQNVPEIEIKYTIHEESPLKATSNQNIPLRSLFSKVIQSSSNLAPGSETEFLFYTPKYNPKKTNQKRVIGSSPGYQTYSAYNSYN